MKYLLLLIFISSITSALKGEYLSYSIKFEIIDVRGQSILAYTSVDAQYIDTDSLQNTLYLRQALDLNYQHLDKRDTLIYFRERVTYYYRYVGDSAGTLQKIYQLNHCHGIAERDIQSIRILTMEEDKIYEAIASPLSASDTLWSDKPPLEAYAFGAYLCIHYVYVHAFSDNVRKVLILLKNKQDQIRDIRITSENGDQLDQEFWQIIPQLYGEKVVIITECTD